MSFRRVGVAAAAVFAVAFALALVQPANAAIVTKALGDSGWSARYDNTEISLTLLNPPADVDEVAWVVLQKVAQFDQGPNEFGFINPFEISFIQNSAEATQYVVIDKEYVFNDSGVDWTSFRFIIEDPMADVGGGAVFDQAQSATFSVDPFTNKVFSADSRELTVSGGVVPHSSPNDEWRPGTTGSLFINGNPFDNGGIRRSFVFKEQPNPGEFVIPLPASAWTALSGLIGLGVIGAAKHWRRVLG
jgi:hypothetical protein